MDILINVSKQRLKLATNLKKYVSGSQEFVRFVFGLNSYWRDLLTFAQFGQNGNTYNRYLDDENAVYLPAEIEAGECTLTLFGSGNNVIATTNYLTLTIDENILVSDATSTEISESLYEQLVDMVRNVSNGTAVADDTNDMTDKNKIYVYIGSETGMTNGNWYYWNGSIWASGGIWNAIAVETDKTLSIEDKAADGKAVGSLIEIGSTQPVSNANKIWIDPTEEEIEIPEMSDLQNVENKIDDLKSDIKFEKLSLLYKEVIVINDIEDGYYSTIDGQKCDNSSSTNYKRVPYLIPVDELSLYVSNIYVNAVCFDKDETFLSSLMIYPVNTKSIRNILPVNTAFIGLYATNATEFTLQKINGVNFDKAEYPYSEDTYIYINECWCNENGTISETDTFDMLIVPNVIAGERFYISNDASYNCLCFDANGTLLSTTSELRSPIGKVYTVPNNAVVMYVNIYRSRTKGVNSEMADYLVKLNDKKILAIGDSLTWLDGRANYGGALYFSGWQRQLRLAGYDVFNAGFSDYPYATGLNIIDNVDYSIYKEIVTNTYNVSGYDYIILLGGTNDVLYDGELGTREVDYSNRVFDATKFNGALSAIISYIRTNNSTAKILLASFPKSEAISRTFINASARIDEIKYNANFWSCKYVDIFADMNVQPTYDGFDLYFYDDNLPNYYGMQTIGELILKALKTYE